MMEHSIDSRHKRLFSAMLIGAAGLYGLANSNPVNATDLVPEMCMADAYMEVNNLDSLPQDKLNCTAEDVEIAEIFDESISECTPGEVVQFTASITIVTNANERYDTTFYNSLTGLTPNLVQPDTMEDIPLPGGSVASYPYLCSLLIPDASAADNIVFADLDSDACGDITKANGSDTYILEDQTITMLCEDVDSDGQADFSYCAAWDNQSRNNCTLDRDPVPGQVPNTKSKCNCDVLTTNIFIKPDAPEMTKTLIGDAAADEPQGTFKYQVSITNVSPTSDIIINAVEDIVRSPTDPSVNANFDLSTTSNTTSGNLTLLAEHVEHTCDEAEAFGGLPLTLTPTSTTVTCVIVVQINDEDLPDDQSDELYRDFVRATVVDKNDAAVGDNTCDPTHPDTPFTPSNGTCTNVVEVAMQDVGISITINKFAIDGPGYNCMGSVLPNGECDGAVYIDEPGGDVTYKLEIANTSTVDPLTVTALEDVVDASTLNLLSGGLTGNTCDDSLPIQLAIKDAPGDSFSCEFVRNVSGGLITVHNDATVYAEESAGFSEGNTTQATDGENVTITDVPPAVVLTKKVKSVAGLMTDGDFADSAIVNEPEGDVIYQFTVKNTSSSQEDIRILSLTDATLGGSRVTQTGGDCAFDGTVTVVYNATYTCTIEATVTGNAGEDLVNTAFVTITDEETNLDSNEDTATVFFNDVGPQLTLDFAYSVLVFAKIDTTGGFEDLTIDALRIRGVDIPLEGATDETDPAMRLLNPTATRTRDGLAFNACEVGDIIAPDTQKLCYFVVQLLPVFSDIDFEALKTGVDPVEIILSDPEGTSVKFEADVDVSTTKYGPL